MDMLKPILVTSPTIRCGTTLLQRLLCSSTNALIYGEEIAKDLEMQLQLFASRKMIYAHSRARFAGSLDRVMQGDTNDWIPDLMPDIDGYLLSLHQGAFAGLSYCRQHANDNGRELWGFKFPGWPPHMMRMLLDTMPSTNVIYISRRLAECVRSAKAWGELQSDADTQRFCAQWAAHMNFMRKWQDSRSLLMLQYEELVHEPGRTIEQLCGFLPFKALKSEVLLHKINNLVEGRDTRRDHNDYIEPAVLTTHELNMIDAALATVVS